MTSSRNPTLAAHPTIARNSAVALRVARDDDAAAVRRLAALDDSPPLQGQVLLALVDDEAVAAASLSDGRVVANPFVPTADTVTLLSLRAAQLSERPARRRLARLRAA
jgi:hypothetical protein